MPRNEETGLRDLTYSHWHRVSLPPWATCTDVDFNEYCAKCLEPISLVEVSRGLNNTKMEAHYSKKAVRRLAEKAQAPLLLVLYEPAGDEEICTNCGYIYKPGGIVAFRAKILHPEETDWKIMTPEEYRDWLLSFRYKHRCYHNGKWVYGRKNPPQAGCLRGARK